MGIDYRTASGVGVKYEEIKLEDLAEKAKDILYDMFTDSQYYENACEEHCPDRVWGLLGLNKDEILKPYIEEFWEDLGWEKLEFFENLGLTEVSNWGFDGDIDMIGTPFYAKISTYKEDLEKAIKDFKEVLNVEPEIFNGFYIY